MTIRFDNRVAIVTGAGNGLGRAHALLLASCGAKVVVNDPGGAVDGKGGGHAAADKVVAEIKAAGGEAVPNYDSVADPASAANIVKTAVDSFGTVDIVVNNAGVLRDKTFHNMTVEDFDFVVKVHFLGTAYVTHAAWPIMRAKAYGRVVVTSSNSGIYGNFGQANYAGAKLAVVGFMNALRLEGQKYNIFVNALAPVAGTRMTESLMTAEMLAKLDPAFVSPMVAWLCSEQCQRTGEIWSAGAGYFARIEYREAPGVRITGRSPTPEDVADNIEKIADLSTSKVYRTSTEEVAAVVVGP
ncbi:MAG: SDR family NAD(P)-dependent oxidoreductase [Rhodospirillales bacterium]|nr:SDR family NAD(P)-dependent oxidoreductase [Rhodospirillales bacterium]